MNKQKMESDLWIEEQICGCQREGDGKWANGVKGNQKYRLPVIGKVFIDIVITLYGDRWELHI